MISGQHSQTDGDTCHHDAANPQNFRTQVAAAFDSFAEPRLICGEYKECVSDGILNTCHNWLARHVPAGGGDIVALTDDRPTTRPRGVERPEQIDDAQSKIVLTASCRFEFVGAITCKPLVYDAFEVSSDGIKQVVLLQRGRAICEDNPETHTERASI
jgi:hypothetical protein